MRAGLLLWLLLVLPATVWGAVPGDKLFNRKCAMCHQVQGRGGAIGPDLTMVASRLSAAQMQAKVMYPKKTVPATSMPSFATLPQAEMQALLAYLGTLR